MSLTYSDRLSIKEKLEIGKSPKKIADEIGCHVNTIYNELKRGRDKDGRKIIYNPHLAQNLYEENKRHRKNPYKLLKDEKLRRYIEKMIVEHKFSPKAVLHKIKKDGLDFDVKISSVNTIYSAIRKGLLEGVGMEHLHRKVKIKKERVIKKAKRPSAGTSIDERPLEIALRDTFGHWEMDCVIGQKSNKNTILVLTERLTRYEIVLKLNSKTVKSVVSALNYLERKLGRHFYPIFKSISVDNGREFNGFFEMEKAKYRVGNRTKIYYCHPYTSCERGTNENNNRFIRYFFKKGENLDTRDFTKSKLRKVQDWINDYPRDIFNGSSAQELMDKELAKLTIKKSLPLFSIIS